MIVLFLQGHKAFEFRVLVAAQNEQSRRCALKRKKKEEKIVDSMDEYT
jgi:hypothetical protein